MWRGQQTVRAQATFENLPQEKEHEAVVDNATINAADLLPKSKAYYTFSGSLTTPPSSEGVTLFVLKHPNTVSTEQVAAFGKSYPMNARPVQPLHGRRIAVSK
jgi:carbonic anhydrase